MTNQQTTRNAEIFTHEDRHLKPQNNRNGDKYKYHQKRNCRYQL